MHHVKNSRGFVLTSRKGVLCRFAIGQMEQGLIPLTTKLSFTFKSFIKLSLEFEI